MTYTIWKSSVRFYQIWLFNSETETMKYILEVGVNTVDKKKINLKNFKFLVVICNKFMDQTQSLIPIFGVNIF